MNAKKIFILVCEPMAPEGLAILHDHPDFAVEVALNLSPELLREKIAGVDCLLVRSQTTVDQALIAEGKKLKLIGRAGVGVDNIDVNFAKKNNIAVINTPSGNSISTAELAIGFMLSLARKIPFAHAQLREGKWQREKFKGVELFQKTLGLIGFGNVGRALARRALAFDMKVVAYDPIVDEEIFLECGAQKKSLDHVFLEADFLSLHCILNESSQNIINHQNIAKMKRGVFLINGARGELVDNHALIKALDDGHIAGAALDVFTTEPPSPHDPVLHHPKIVVTPHLGASTEEAQKRVSTLLAEQTVGFFSGNKNLTRVV